MTHAVVGCKCGRKWAVELRYKTTQCPRCGKRYEVKKRQFLWRGSDARAAASAVAKIQQGDYEIHV